MTAGDRGFVPMLARSWTRRDSVTLVFDLDPRARWHDGAPVTARDVVFTFEPRQEPRHRAPARRAPAHTSARSRPRVIIGWSSALPVRTRSSSTTPPFTRRRCRPICWTRCRPTRWRTRTFVAHPVGSGPYRWCGASPDSSSSWRRTRLLSGQAQDRAGDHSGRRGSGRPAQPAPERPGRRDGQRGPTAGQHSADPERYRLAS